MNKSDFKTVVRILVAIIAVLAAITCFTINMSWEDKMVSRCTATTVGTLTDFTTPINLTGRNHSRYNTIKADYKVGNLTYNVRGKTKAWLARNAEVTVHYDPNDPKVGYAGDYPRSGIASVFVYVGSGLALAGSALRPLRSGRRPYTY